MAGRDNEKKVVRCSFCGKSQEDVARLIEGPGVYICDSCIEFCGSLLNDEVLPKTYAENKPLLCLQSVRISVIFLCVVKLMQKFT